MNSGSRFAIFTKLVTWLSIAGLLLAVFWRSSAIFQLLLEFAVCISVTMAILQAINAGKYILATAFVAIGMPFNPIRPVHFSPGAFPWIDLICVGMLLLSAVQLPIPLFEDN